MATAATMQTRLNLGAEVCVAIIALQGKVIAACQTQSRECAMAPHSPPPFKTPPPLLNLPLPPPPPPVNLQQRMRKSPIHVSYTCR